MMSQTEMIHFWFGSSSDDLQVIHEKSSLWWSKDKITDEGIRKQFNGLLDNLV